MAEAAAALELPVLHIDEHMLVVDKPEGIRTVPGMPQESEVKGSGRAWHYSNRLGRQEYWRDVIRATHSKLAADPSQARLAKLMGQLLESKSVSVPRNRTKFLRYAKRCVNLSEEAEALEMWQVLDGELKQAAGAGTDCVLSRVTAKYPSAKTVHRLDMGTSGVLAFALNDETCIKLSEAFKERSTEKEYIAVVMGEFGAARDGKGDLQHRGTIEAKIRPDPSNRPYQVFDEEGGREAVTEWEVVERCKPKHEEGEAGNASCTSRVRLRPKTGRTHQLRMHCRFMNCPIVGDTLYAGEAARQQPRMMLHAQALTLSHPDTGERMTFTSPCPF
ncbi:unnamed protein product [Chrysoparadoxa australica]